MMGKKKSAESIQRQKDGLRAYYASNPDVWTKPKDGVGTRICKKCGKTTGSKPSSCIEQRHLSRYNSLLDKSENIRWKLRVEVVRLLGGKCVDCGHTDIRILCINHKLGGGSKENQGSNKWRKMCREILAGIRDKNEFDVRCYNHNILYEYQRGARKPPPKWAEAGLEAERDKNSQ